MFRALELAGSIRKCAFDGLLGDIAPVGALEVEGEDQIFADRCRTLTGSLVGECQPLMDLHQAGREAGGPFPVPDGFFEIALGEVDVRHADILLGGFFHAAQAFEDVGTLFQRDGIVWGRAGGRACRL